MCGKWKAFAIASFLVLFAARTGWDAGWGKEAMALEGSPSAAAELRPAPPLALRHQSSICISSTQLTRPGGRQGRTPTRLGPAFRCNLRCA